MKALTLTTLLATSAAAGAAAGGPFFFAHTTPQSIAFSGFQNTATSAYTAWSQTVTVSTNFVLTDLNVLNGGNNNYRIMVNGVDQLWWRSASGSNCHFGFADGAGVPVPAGATLTIESSSDTPVSVTGYHY